MTSHRDSCRHEQENVAQIQPIPMADEDNASCQRVQPLSNKQTFKLSKQKIASKPTHPVDASTTPIPMRTSNPKVVTISLRDLDYNIKRIKIIPENKEIDILQCRLCNGFIAKNLGLMHR